jgi:hypothetical protein
VSDTMHLMPHCPFINNVPLEHQTTINLTLSFLEKNFTYFSQ